MMFCYELSGLVGLGDAWGIQDEALDAGCDELRMKDPEHSPSLTPKRRGGRTGTV